MADLISRTAAIAEVMQMVERHKHEIFHGELLHYTGVKAMLEALPAVGAVPVTHGRWMVTDAYPHNVYCSKCYKTFAQTHWAVWEDGSLPRDYCPNCGARMDGERRDEDGTAD